MNENYLINVKSPCGETIRRIGLGGVWVGNVPQGSPSERETPGTSLNRPKTKETQQSREVGGKTETYNGTQERDTDKKARLAEMAV